MPVESGTKLSDLNPVWPLGSDPKSQGDDHLRLIKQIVQGDAASLADGGAFLVHPTVPAGATGAQVPNADDIPGLAGPNSTIGPVFPGSPDEGDLHYMTVRPVGLFVWYNDGNSLQWVQTNGTAEMPDVPYFEENHSGTGAPSYRINGTTLECWGFGSADQNVGLTIAFPKVFANVPSVQVTADSTLGRFATARNITTTGAVLFNYENAGASRPGDVSWYAVGQWDGVS